MAIQFFLVQNRLGKTRLSKWYAPKTDDQRRAAKHKVHQLVASRDQKFQSNFVDYNGDCLVYRRYAGLFFCMCVDRSENELACLELIHLFVETLDVYFGSVCELDLVFNFYKVYAALDELILAGEIQETSKQAILSRLEEFEQHTR